MAPFERTRAMAHWRDPNYTTGRPTLYRPEYCDLVIEKMAEGLSLTAFAGHIRVSLETVYAWMKTHKEFSEAVSRANPARVLALEVKLLKATKGAQTTAAIFGLRNAAPHEWRDVKYQEHQHNIITERMSDDQLYAIAGQRAPHQATTLHDQAPVLEGEYTREQDK